MRTHLLISCVLVLFLLATSSSSRAQEVSADKPAVPTDNETLRTLPKSVLDAELRSARGPSFRLSDYSGKVLVVNLWATWCGPCQFETPALVKLQRRFRSQGVQVIELSTENPDNSTAEVRKWVRRFRVHYKVGWAPPKVALTLMQGRDAIPQAFVVSRTGRIGRRFIGFNPVVTVEKIKLAIQEAINDKDGLPKPNQ
jgi:thiol-disulfide isomerase/thioredoxin